MKLLDYIPLKALPPARSEHCSLCINNYYCNGRYKNAKELKEKQVPPGTVCLWKDGREDHAGFKFSSIKGVALTYLDDGVLKIFIKTDKRRIKWIIGKNSKGLFCVYRWTPRTFKDMTLLDEMNLLDRLNRDILVAFPVKVNHTKGYGLIRDMDKNCSAMHNNIGSRVNKMLKKVFGTTDLKSLRYPNYLDYLHPGMRIPPGMADVLNAKDPRQLFKHKVKVDKGRSLYQLWLYKQLKKEDINHIRTILGANWHTYSDAKFILKLIDRYGINRVARWLPRVVRTPKRRPELDNYYETPEYLAYNQECDKTMYFDDIKRMHYQFPHIEWPKVPNLKVLHDYLTYETASARRKLQIEKMKEPIRPYKPLEGLEFEGYRVVFPKNGYDLDDWGKHFRNCVGGYGDAARSGNKVVFALEKDGVKTHCCDYNPREQTVTQCSRKFNQRDDHVQSLLHYSIQGRLARLQAFY
jgi:hypothetical protein